MNYISRLTVAFIACVAFAFPSFSQNSNTKSVEINWLSFEQAVEKNKTEPKKMFIDVYTHWCGWCKRMDATTFKDSAVVNYMNKNFHAVKLNAETKDTIRFQGNDFVYRAENRANDIAVSLLNKRMSYPTTVYLDENVAILSPLPGYLTAEQIMPVLKFYGDNIYKTKSWQDYTNETNAAIPATVEQKNPSNSNTKKDAPRSFQRKADGEKTSGTNKDVSASPSERK